MIPIRAMKILCASMVLLGAGLILLSLNFGMQTASANTQYGILGQQAPGLEWDLNIPMAHAAGNPQNHQIPAIMKKYRSGGTPWTVLIDPKGKVVYNHFHIEPPQATAIINQLLTE